MVKIIATHHRKSEKGPFISFELLGDMELLQSQKSGKMYATAKKCFISTTFDEETAKGFIRQTLHGTIGRVSCEPYDFKMPLTGEVITLSHSYSYIPPEEGNLQAMEANIEDVHKIMA